MPQAKIDRGRAEFAAARLIFFALSGKKRRAWFTDKLDPPDWVLFPRRYTFLGITPGIFGGLAHSYRTGGDKKRG
jgi:hypothetical protein